jgi:hypothetical protein
MQCATARGSRDRRAASALPFLSIPPLRRFPSVLRILLSRTGIASNKLAEECQPMTTKEYIESRRDLRRLLNVAWFMGAVFASGTMSLG